MKKKLNIRADGWSWRHLVWVVGALLGILLLAGAVRLAYDDGQDEGYTQGWDGAWDIAHERGYDMGYEDGSYRGSLLTCQAIFDMLEEEGMAEGGTSSLCPDIAATTYSP